MNVCICVVLSFFRGKQSLDQSGIGAEAVGDVKQEDDDFEVYRKRMMLAYRFRPNPLVCSTLFVYHINSVFYLPVSP